MESFYGTLGVIVTPLVSLLTFRYRPGLVRGSDLTKLLPKNSVDRAGNRVSVVKWDLQKEVLGHVAVREGFGLTVDGIQHWSVRVKEF
ncbi:hypothetical protein NC651_021920 [Populus alba x Populus x berolinensis]|nr:hypothetical protein NC651_021920 [Populus alba x Populus x berolinensis]